MSSLPPVPPSRRLASRIAALMVAFLAVLPAAGGGELKLDAFRLER